MNHCRSYAPFFRTLLFLLLPFLFLGPVVLSSQTTPELGIREHTPDARAFVGATIVVSPDQKIENGTLLIEHGRIIAVGPEVIIPKGVTVVDLTGYFIYPGFIDLYTDYGLPGVERHRRPQNARPEYYGDRIGGNAWNDAVKAEKNWVDQFKPNKNDALELEKLGFTTVQSVQKDGILRGRGFITQLGSGLPNDLILRPSGPHAISFDKGSSSQDYPSSIMGGIAIIRQAFYDSRWYARAQAAYAINPGQTKPEYNAALEALATIGSEPLICDAGNSSLGLYRISRLKSEFNLRLLAVGSGREYEWISDFARMNIPILLPLNFPDKPKVGSFEDDLDLSLATLRQWEMAPGNPAALEKAGAVFCLTTHGLKKKEQFRENLLSAIKRGLSERTALAALTTIPAEVSDLSSDAGTLEKGKLANFFITDGNYFDKNTTIFEVWTGSEKTHIENRPVVDFRGDYTLTLPDGNYQLSIKGKPSKYEGVLKQDSLSEKLANISVDQTYISFSVKLDSSKGTGLARFSGRKTDQLFGGECELADGALVKWSALPIVLAEDSTEKIENNEADTGEESFEPVSHLTSPNMAFGFTDRPQKQNVLIKNATVWTSDDAGTLTSTDILVKDGKFAEIGSELAAPPDYTVIDATGKHVTPGIIDAHSHIAAEGDINEGTHAITPEVRISDIIDPLDINIYRQLAGGVTTSMILHGSANPIGGQCEVIKLRWGSNPEEMKLKGAPPLIKFALGENVTQAGWGEQYTIRYPQSRMGVEAIISDAFRAAVAYENSLNSYNALSKKDQERTVPPRKDLQLDALVEVLHDRMLVHCHSYMASETVMLMQVAEQFGFGIDVFIHMLEGYKIANEMAAHGASATTFSDWWAYKFEVYDAIPYNAGLMYDRHVLTTLNSDNGDLARRLNQEAGKVVMYNDVDQTEALRMVTINSAIQLGVADKIGSITIGKDADFVIWSDNPLSMYARAEQTWIEGTRYYDITTNDQLVAATATEKNALIQKLLNSGSSNGSRGKNDPPKRGDAPDEERSAQ